jgi:DNA-binding GntR family transcriptional regulator
MSTSAACVAELREEARSLSMQKFERPKSLAEVVTARLRREIIEGEFDLGQALSESKIAARYDVSRTPVREAFAALGHEGLVRTEPQSGTFVFTMDREQFAQLSETRSILETAALRLAMERGHPALLREWKRLVASMTAALRDGEPKRYTRADGDFHAVLFEIADNPFLDAAGQSFSAKMAAVRSRLGAQPEHMQKSYREHVDLLDLVERNDVEGAAALLERHIRHKGESFWATPEKSRRSRWEKISQLAE